MTGSASNAGLRRKARIARDDHDARAMSATRALRLGLEKAANEDLELGLVVQAVQRAEPDHASMLGMIPGDALLLLLDGPQGMRGVVTLDAGIMTSLIEAQTMGQVLSRPVPERRLTRTDAAMAAPLVDGVLRRMALSLADHPDGYWTKGYRFGAMLDDVRSVGLALSAADYHVFHLTLDIGPGARMGAMTLALPCMADPADAPSTLDQTGARQQFQGRVMDAPVRLEAVLCRLSLPLSQLSQIKVGDVLPLSTDASRDITVEAVGRPVATARLGKIDGLRAVRLLGQGQVRDMPPETDAGGDGMAGREQAGASAMMMQTVPALTMPQTVAEVEPDSAGTTEQTDHAPAPMEEADLSGTDSGFDMNSFGGFGGLDLGSGPAAA